MKFNISETIQRAEKEFGLESGGYFKPKEGANKLRLLSAALAHASFYRGDRTFKYVCWVYDYFDQKVKLYFMPPTVLKSIESLQLSSEYGFDEVPMPYDLTLHAKNAGTKEVDYQVMPARENTPLTTDCLEQLNKKEDINAVLTKLKEKEQADPNRQPSTPAPVTQPAAAPAPTDEIVLEDIPF